MNYQTISVRIPTDIFSTIKRTAKIEHRSMNQQIILFLENEVLKSQEKEKVEVK